MKLKYLFIILLFIGAKLFSQTKKPILFKIDGTPYYSEEFINVYKKNLSVVSDKKTSVDDYLKLFINYKLKVKEAKIKRLDTFQKFRNELKQYKNNLVKPYLKDKDATNKLVAEAYQRLKSEVNVSHILVFLNDNATPKDTLKAYNTLIEARNLVLNGADFGTVAKQYSKDPTVNENLGNIGYFTALQMVYNFENVAYNTPVGEISMPFRTKFGYHILKVNDRRNAKGEVEVAHIMIKNNPKYAKQKIDSIYQILTQTKTDFGELAKKLSEDRATGIKGGKLNKFGSGKMIEAFAKVAFSLKTEGEISKPFKTKFGWHIVKLLKKYPLQSFNKLSPKLTKEIEKDLRATLVSKSLLNKLYKQYNVKINVVALEQFTKQDWRKKPQNFNQFIIDINGDKIPQSKFITYLKTVKNSNVKSAFEGFKQKEVLFYYKNNIEHSNPEFAEKYKEFKEGLLLFDLLEKEVWEKAKDSIGILKYFNANKSQKYNGKELIDIKGNVVADYQNYLEYMFTKKLKEKYDVEIIKSEKKRVKKIKF
jgi:peptidyl-prolyl cis-trans isomerase SurA